MSNEPRYQAQGYSVHDLTTQRDIAHTESWAAANNICDLLNAGEQARTLAAAVAGLGYFQVQRTTLADTPYLARNEAHPRDAMTGYGDTPAAAIVALWAAVQATGEGE